MMNAKEVQQVFESAGFKLSEGSDNYDCCVHFDSSDAEMKYQGYVEMLAADSVVGEYWQVILLGGSWFVGEECTTPAELLHVFNNMEALLGVAKAERGEK